MTTQEFYDDGQERKVRKNIEHEFWEKNGCPHCGGRSFFSGPKGGGAQDILCANTDCLHEYAVTRLGNQVKNVMIADDLGKADTARLVFYKIYDGRLPDIAMIGNPGTK